MPPLSWAKLLFCVCLLFPGLLAGAEARFWDKQDFANWTRQQVDQFTTSSPWARQVTAVLISNESNMAGGGARTRRSGQASGETSPNVPSPSALPALQAIVRWASAQPMRQILRLSLPASFDGRYILSVNGLPFSGETAELIEETTLQVKRGQAVHPEIAYQDPADTSTVYFGFLPSTVSLDSGKTAIFSMVDGPYEIRTRFNLAEMKYHHEPSF